MQNEFDGLFGIAGTVHIMQVRVLKVEVTTFQVIAQQFDSPAPAVEFLGLRALEAGAQREEDTLGITS
jgi:hypothetical protein